MMTLTSLPKNNLFLQCPSNNFITGFESVHDNQYQDRRFKVTCCSFECTCRRNCDNKYTQGGGSFKGVQSFIAPDGYFLYYAYQVYFSTYDK